VELNKAMVSLRRPSPVLRELRGYWSWWTQELQGMLPQPLRRYVLARRQRVYLDLNGPILAVSYGNGDSRRSLGTYPLTASGPRSTATPEAHTLIDRAAELVLSLPPEKVLIRSLTLPLAAEENLHEVLGFEMDRNTPFSADQVYYDHVVTARDPKRHTIKLNLVVTPRAVLDELLAQLGEIGFRPQRVTTRGRAGGEILAVNLHPGSAQDDHPKTPYYLNLLLGGLLIALFAGVATLPIVHKKQKLRSMEAELAEAVQQAAAARRLGEDVARLTADANFLLEKKQSTPMALELIAELTRILPNDTWLTHLDITPSEINIRGETASAAALIPLIETSPALADARFRSPVTRMPQGDAERFHISARAETEAAP
jgi:general secretion pathway protein L